MIHNNQKTAGSLRGFTLIEILVVIGIIAVLAAIVIIAINPAKQFAQARNTQRESDINTILNAIGQNTADNKGVWTCPAAITSASSSADSLATCLVPTYIPSMPEEPLATTTGSTLGYQVSVNSLGRYLVCAPGADEPALGASNPGPLCLTR